MACPADLDQASTVFYKSISKFSSATIYNVVDQRRGTKYLISNENCVEFFTLLNDYKQRTHLCTHLSEVQFNSVSCLDIDFDIKQTGSTCELLDSDYKFLLGSVLDVLDEYFDLENFFIAVLKRKRVEPKGEYFKDGIHIRVLVKFSPEERYFIVGRLMELNLFQNLSFRTSIINGPDVIDLQSLSAQVLTYESNKPLVHKPSYALHMLYNVQCEEVVRVEDPSIYKNLHLELSILHEGVIEKPRAKCKVPIDVVLPAVAVDDEDDMSIDDYYIKRMLSMMSKKRYTYYRYWHKIVFALAKLDVEMPVAIEFSKKWPSYDRLAEKKIRDLYAGAKKDRRKFVNYMRILEYYANADDHDRFMESQYNRYANKMYASVIETNGNVKPLHVANEIKEKYKNHWLYTNKTWYEYNIDNAHWEVNCINDYPVEMYHEISVRITQLLKDTKLVIETTVNNLTAENMAEVDQTDKLRYNKILFNLSKSIDHYIEMPMIKQTIEHLQKKFAIPKRHKFDDVDHRYLIGVKNGIYDLENDALIDYGPEYYITRSTKANYDTDYIFDDMAAVTNKYTQRLLRAVGEIIPEPDALEYIMCYLASSLDADKKAPVFLILFGVGKNGKSTLDELTLFTLGSCVDNGYGYKMPSNFFTSGKDTNGPNSTKMGIKYSRYTTTSELEHGQKLAMAKIKEMTSDTISGNEKYQVQDNFRPVCNFALTTNVKPNIVTTDYGTWRRLRVYECKSKFVKKPTKPNERQCDSTLYKKVTSQQEYADAWLGILIHYYQHRYKKLYDRDITRIACPTIDLETKKYERENDHLSTFISNNMERVDSRDEFITIDALFSAYELWYKKNVSSHFKWSIYNLETELYKTKIEDCIVKDQNITYIVNNRMVSVEDKIQNIISSR